MVRRTQEEKLRLKKRRTQIVSAYNTGGDWRAIAKDLNVPISTAYRWVLFGDTPDSRGGSRFHKVKEF